MNNFNSLSTVNANHYQAGSGGWGVGRQLFYIANAIFFLAVYVAGRQFFSHQQDLWKLLKTFDIRNAECGCQEDKPVLLASIQAKFRRPQAEQETSKNPVESEAAAGEGALDKFNVEVKRLLRDQVLFKGYRVLPYTMIVAARVVRWWERTDCFVRDFGNNMWFVCGYLFLLLLFILANILLPYLDNFNLYITCSNCVQTFGPG